MNIGFCNKKSQSILFSMKQVRSSADTLHNYKLILISLLKFQTNLFKLVKKFNSFYFIFSNYC